MYRIVNSGKVVKKDDIREIVLEIIFFGGSFENSKHNGITDLEMGTEK